MGDAVFGRTFFMVATMEAAGGESTVRGNTVGPLISATTLIAGLSVLDVREAAALSPAASIPLCGTLLLLLSLVVFALLIDAATAVLFPVRLTSKFSEFLILTLLLIIVFVIVGSGPVIPQVSLLLS